MKIEELIAALQANADRTMKPVAVEVEGVGTIYVRRRTIAEFEQMSDAKPVEGQGRFAPALARLLCDENGARFSDYDREALSALLSRQPENVFQKIVAASDGDTDPKKAEVSGN